jgi:hypothetical protein
MPKAPPPPPSPAQLQREARLAAALRENLHRRKAQTRARAAEDTPPTTADTPKPQD